MFRKANSAKLSFSWNRLVLNTFPNFSNDSKDDVELSPKEQDDLFCFQIVQPEPRFLNAQSFFLGGVVESPAQSPKILSSLQKVSIVNPTAPFVDTTKITRNFPNQVASISIHRQRKLVALLFFWEEELTRWRLLDEEEEEIKRVLEQIEEAGNLSRARNKSVAGDASIEESRDEEDLKIALSKIIARRVMPPALRRHEGTGELPVYGDQRTLSVSGGGAGSASSQRT